MGSQNECFWATMTILYLHYCAIYPPQVVLQNETKEKQDCVYWSGRKATEILLIVVPSALTHSQKALKKKNNISKIYPEYIWADAAFNAWLNLTSITNCYWPSGHDKCKFLSTTFKLFVYFWFVSLFLLHETLSPRRNKHQKHKLQTQY